MRHGFGNNFAPMPQRQQGAITMFTAVLILILLTELIIYAVHVGVFEQRKSSNEMRQKEAFHLADSAVEFAKEFVKYNKDLVPSYGTDGWLNAGSLRWESCADAAPTCPGTHPCCAEPADNSTDFRADLRNNMYFYSDGSGNAANLPIDLNSLLTDPTRQVSAQALLCMLDIDRDADPIIQGCTTEASAQDDRYFMVTLLARGEADCDSGICTAKALVADKFGSFAPGGGEGAPNVPLTTRSTFPPTGTAEIVPNPNGGGEGVPTSAWMNANDSCPNQAVVDPTGGSWSTCERHEWYGTDIMPDDYACPTANCSCGQDEKRISYSEQGDTKISFDLVADDEFPCDLWQYMFGVPKYEADGVTINDESVDFVKYGLAKEVLSDCSSLDENSSGIYWISGNTCSVNANTQIGTAEFPVILLSAAGTTRFNGGAKLFGVLFVTDVENANADFDAVGSMTIYGAAVIDATLAQYQGTFQIVYLENVIETAFGDPGFGDVAGAWSDFHPDWR